MRHGPGLTGLLGLCPQTREGAERLWKVVAEPPGQRGVGGGNAWALAFKLEPSRASRPHPPWLELAQGTAAPASCSLQLEGTAWKQQVTKETHTLSLGMGGLVPPGPSTPASFVPQGHKQAGPRRAAAAWVPQEQWCGRGVGANPARPLSESSRNQEDAVPREVGRPCAPRPVLW